MVPVQLLWCYQGSIHLSQFKSSVFKPFTWLFLYLLSEEVNMQDRRAQSPILPVQGDVENTPAWSHASGGRGLLTQGLWHRSHLRTAAGSSGKSLRNVGTNGVQQMLIGQFTNIITCWNRVVRHSPKTENNDIILPQISPLISNVKNPSLYSWLRLKCDSSRA